MDNLYNKLINNIASGIKKSLFEYTSIIPDKKKRNNIKILYKPKNNRQLRNLVDLLVRKKVTNFNCIDVSLITDFSNIFAGHDIGEIDLSGWDVSNGTTFGCMFKNCKRFNADLSMWDVSNSTDFYNMFYNCFKFNSDLSLWEVGNCTDFSGMFRNCF